MLYMPKRYTADELIKIVKKAGWYFARSKGSHRIYLHVSRSGSVTIPYHKGKTLHPFIVGSILKQAGLK